MTNIEKIETQKVLDELESIKDSMIKSTEKFIKAVNHSINKGNSSVNDEIPDYIFQDNEYKN